MDKKILVCKKTGKEFYDIDNVSGSLTTHLLTIYDNIDVPSNNYQRKKYEKLHGKRWFDDYFTLITKEVRETRKCRICGWETVDIENKTGSFETHLKQHHSIPIEEYLVKYPEDYIEKFGKDEYLIGVDLKNHGTLVKLSQQITNGNVRNANMYFNNRIHFIAKLTLEQLEL